LLGIPAQAATEARLAYRLAFDVASPDDFFCLRQGVQEQYQALTFNQLLATLRLSRYDPRILLDCLFSLSPHVGEVSAGQRRDLLRSIELTWENYYFIGEPRDLPFEIALFLHLLGEPAAALRFFERSLALFEEDPRTHFNMGVCLYALGRKDEAHRHF